MVSTGDQLAIECRDLDVQQLGEATIPSPIATLRRDRPSSPHYVHETDRVLLDDTVEMAVARGVPVSELPSFEPGGPREQHLLRPGGHHGRHRHLRRAVPRPQQRDPRPRPRALRALRRHRDPRLPQRLRGPGQGRRADAADPAGASPTSTTRAAPILGTSRGDQDPEEMIATLVRLNVYILFVVGGDGTLRGAQKIADAAAAREVRDLRGGRAQDHRQRHPVHRPQLRLPDRLRPGHRVDPRRAHRGVAPRPTGSAWSS